MRSDNRIKDAFEDIKASKELKASTKAFLQDMRNASSRNECGQSVWGRTGKRQLLGLRPGAWVISGAVCAMLALFIGVGSHILLRVPFSYVSIDVNPSIELELNRLDRVISARAYNGDGEAVLSQVSVMGKYYTDAIDMLVGSSAMQPYLSEKGELTFTVASGDGDRERQLVAGIENCHGCLGNGGRSMGADVEMVKEAHDLGFSLGKYTAYKTLLQYDPSITASECHDMTMGEIHGLIRQHVEHGDNGAGCNGDREGNGDHKDSKDREGSGNHKDSEDREGSGNHKDSQDRGGSGKHKDSQDRGGSGNHKDSQDRGGNGKHGENEKHGGSHRKQR